VKPLPLLYLSAYFERHRQQYQQFMAIGVVKRIQR